MKHGIFMPPFAELADPRRVARLAADAFPIFAGSSQLPPPPPAEDLAELRAELTELGAPRSLDLVVRVSLHRLSATERTDVAAALAGACVTWLLEAFAPGQGAAEVETYVRSGPPR